VQSKNPHNPLVFQFFTQHVPVTTYYGNNENLNRALTRSYGSATSSSSVDPSVFLKKEKTSKAMKAYLQRAQEHDEFMKTQKHEFDIGKRHLANMMGESPDMYEKQEQIDVSRMSPCSWK
jgi:hypothetical protein